MSEADAIVYLADTLEEIATWFIWLGVWFLIFKNMGCSCNSSDEK